MKDKHGSFANFKDGALTQREECEKSVQTTDILNNIKCSTNADTKKCDIFGKAFKSKHNLIE